MSTHDAVSVIFGQPVSDTTVRIAARQEVYGDGLAWSHGR